MKRVIAAVFLVMGATAFADGLSPNLKSFVGSYEVQQSQCSNNMNNAWMNEYEKLVYLDIGAEVITEHHYISALYDKVDGWYAFAHDTTENLSDHYWYRGLIDTAVSSNGDDTHLKITVTSKLKNAGDPDEFVSYEMTKLAGGKLKIERVLQLVFGRGAGMPKLFRAQCSDVIALQN